MMRDLILLGMLPTTSESQVGETKLFNSIVLMCVGQGRAVPELLYKSYR